MSKLKFKATFYYLGSKEVVPNLEYVIQYRNLTTWKRGWVFSATKEEGEITTKNGETKNFYTSEKCIIDIYIKGKPTGYTKWYKIKKSIRVDSDYLHFKDIEHALFIEIPISKLKKVTTQSKGSPTHQSDYYQVQSGDTLDNIAKKFNKDIKQLMDNNNIKDKNKINVGQKVYIGDVKKQEKISIQPSNPNDFVDVKYEVKSGDTLSNIAKKLKVNPRLIAMQNDIPLSDMDKLQVGKILTIKNNRSRSVQEIIKKELAFSKGNALAITQYQPKEPSSKQIFITFSGALYFIGGALDIGIAYDDNGDWMLYVSTGSSGEIDPSKMPHLENGGNSKEMMALLKDEKRLKESLKKDISVSIERGELNVTAKHVSDLKGEGLTLTNSINVGTYSISRVNTYATVEEMDSEGNIIEGDVRGRGFSGTVAVEGRKVKKVVEGKPISITHSVSKSYTIPIFLYDRNERLMKMDGKGIEYVD
ncbi:LysM peptidoglycan-binding domain-containing protein [Acinetobacter sp. RF14B]|uniref:lytic transglycosylase n=1 Tax=Acinetobacter sp. RF14B TaxID=2650965 RepID=UPI001167C184|nr:LysM peptidoglycan-binding domain-containing protein [Acinetobacter sp. RF14B]TQR62701.1 LysM domain-containing protein [Acinetobacter sp. RF14B]